MLTGLNNQPSVSFGNAGITAFLEENVMLNKALLDGTVDVPFVCMSNNKVERRERLRRVLTNYSLCFLSPFITLPLTNRIAMRYVGKLTKSFWSNNHKAINISNKYLKDTVSMMAELTEMSKGKNMGKNPIESLYYKLHPKKQYNNHLNVNELLESVGGDEEKLRRKLINAKNSVLGFDFLFSAGSVSGMAFLNNKLTKDKTKMDGYSAEFELADKETVEKRAQKYKKSEPLRKAITAGLVAGLAALPIAICKGLKSPKTTGIARLIKNNAHLFDYTKGIYMTRLPLFLFLTVGMCGVAFASRNNTELKNNFLLNGLGLSVYFGGDIVINSALAKLSDKFLKTNIIDKNAPKTFKNKILPPTVPIRELSGKSKTVAKCNFITNFAMIAYLFGYGTPKLMNMIVRRDVSKNIKTQNQNQFTNKANITKPHRMEDFIKRLK